MLDSQYAVTEETAAKWRQSVEMMRAMKDAGLTNEAGVAQYEANTLSIEASLHDLAYQRTQTENSLCSLLGEAPHTIVRGESRGSAHARDAGCRRASADALEPSRHPSGRILAHAVLLCDGQRPVGPLSVDHAERYARLDKNNSGIGIVNPGKLIWNAAGSLLQPIFNANANRAQVKIAKASREESRLAFQQAPAECRRRGEQCLDAESVGACESRPAGTSDRGAGACRGVHGTALMQHGTTTHLEV